ncbi:Ribokinase [Pleurostoma richardsiae]|uniref:Ribokinase n=1 Tax=Pleurostoma richardsiae TaxID=41990 RepID=A0AA38RW38_9PEZI|nr:Ribokinase [Pleurostoma richardsiae]
MALQTIAIIGGLDVDLIMVANRIPDRGESVLANQYLETLGGKGANSAIATYRTCHKNTSENNETIGKLKEPIEAGYAAPTTDEKPPPVSEQATTNSEYGDNIQVKMIGAVGDDRYGERFIAELKENGVNASGVVIVPNTHSSVCFVMVENPTRENRCLFTLGATAIWRKEDFMKVEDLGNGMRPDLVVAQMEIDKEVVETMIETAGKAGVDFCLNAAPASPIAKRTCRYITHLLVNESEAAIMSGRDTDEVNEETWPVIAQDFLSRGVKNVIITLGAKGAFYATAAKSDHCPAYQVKVVDTTGAGDTFTGAYASDYLRQKAKGSWDIEGAVVRANKAAALVIQRIGAQDGIPWADEIDDFNASYRVF